MYLNHFNLTEQPFSITPDPRFLYMSARHREALAHLLYGLGEGGGFVQLTGEVGTGKTTICRCLLEQVPDNVDVAMVINPKVTATELIATICDELGIKHPGHGASIKALIDILNRYLLDAHARGRRTVLIIDEAQNLSADVLEQIRLLTNLETSTQKLLQIILIGQPELRELLARDEMRQLSQRVTARYHLEPINREEAGAYISHRLDICGSSRNLFTRRAVDRIHKLSGGIPRLINVLCDRSLLGTYVEGKGIVDHRTVRKAAREVLAEKGEEGRSRSSWLPLLAGSLVVILLAAAAFVYKPWLQLQPVAAPPVAKVEEAPEPEVEMVSAAKVEANVSAPLTTMTGEEEAAEQPAEQAAEQPAGEAADQPEEQAAEQPAGEEGPAEQPEPRPAALADLLQQAEGSWYRASWQGLFARWQVVLPADIKPDFCNYAREFALHCIIGQGDWDTLRLLDRPAVLTLAREDGVRIPVLLQRMNGDNLELVIGESQYRLDTVQVGKYWAGDYVLLVQAPPGGRMDLKTGDRDQDVIWLREQFATAMGVEIPVRDPLLFDYQLQKQVLNFQRVNGLLADGIVGRNTLIRLNSVIDRKGVPRLTGVRTG